MTYNPVRPIHRQIRYLKLYNIKCIKTHFIYIDMNNGYDPAANEYDVTTKNINKNDVCD